MIAIILVAWAALLLLAVLAWLYVKVRDQCATHQAQLDSLKWRLSRLTEIVDRQDQIIYSWLKTKEERDDERSNPQ